jgi:hypothetical protein
MKKLFLYLFLSLMLSMNAHAEVKSTYMLDKCKTAMSGKAMTDEVFRDALTCKMYFSGAWEGALIKHTQYVVKMESMNIDVENGKFVMLAGCLPGKTTLDQLINIFINYMDRNPEQLDNMLMLNISDALEEIFPCKNK